LKYGCHGLRPYAIAVHVFRGRANSATASTVMYLVLRMMVLRFHAVPSIKLPQPH
jgi:hypothetical protein